MALKEIQEQLKTLMAEGEVLSQKAELTAADAERLTVIVHDVTDLKIHAAKMGEFAALSSWAKESGGMLPLTPPGSGMLLGTRPDGTVVVEDKNKSVLVTSDGAYTMPEAQVKAISTPEYMKAFSQYIRNYGREERMDRDALKVVQEGSDTAGGILVPEQLQNRIIGREPTPTVLAGRVTRLTTSRDSLLVPKNTYSSDNLYSSPIRITWVGETVAAGDTSHSVTDPTFGSVRVPIYTAMLSEYVTRDMIEDSAFDIMGYLQSKFQETIDQAYEYYILSGTGAGQPSGILRSPNSTNEPATVVSGAAATLTADGLVDLAFALPPQYDNNAAFVFNKLSTAKAIFKLKDGDGRYLWGMGTQDTGLRVPAVRQRDLLGYPVLMTEHMPNVAASAYPVIFGDLGGYWLINRIGFSIEILRELKALSNQVVIVGRIRFGGLPAEDWKIKVQVVSA